MFERIKRENCFSTSKSSKYGAIFKFVLIFCKAIRVLIRFENMENKPITLRIYSLSGKVVKVLEVEPMIIKL